MATRRQSFNISDIVPRVALDDELERIDEQIQSTKQETTEKVEKLKAERNAFYERANSNGETSIDEDFMIGSVLMDFDQSIELLEGSLKKQIKALEGKKTWLMAKQKQ